jgi:hypothetical protein
MKFNYMPNNDTGLVLRTANNSDVIMPIAGSKFKQNQWNSVLIYVDYSNLDPDYDYTDLLNNSLEVTTPLIPESEKPKVCPVGHTFINGVEDGTGYMPIRLQDRFGMWNTYYHPSSHDLVTATGANTDLRIGFTAIKIGQNACIDDLYIYQTDVLPDGAALTALPALASADSAIATFNEKTVTAKAGGTAEALESTNGRIRIFADSTGVAQTDTFAEDAIVSVVSANGAYKVYNVSFFDAAIDGTSATATATDAAAESCIIVAEYDADGIMVGAAMREADVEKDLTVEYTMKDAENTVRAFLFENKTNISPLCGSISVE